MRAQLSPGMFGPTCFLPKRDSVLSTFIDSGLSAPRDTFDITTDLMLADLHPLRQYMYHRQHYGRRRRSLRQLTRRRIHSPVRKSSDTLSPRSRPPTVGRDPFAAGTSASVVIMTPSRAFGSRGWQFCGDRRSTCDRSRRAAL